MKYQILSSGKNKKSLINLSSAGLALRVVNRVKLIRGLEILNKIDV